MLLLPRSWVTLTSALTSAPEGSRVPMGARRAVPAAKASGRYRFGEGTFPRIPGNDGEAPKAVIRETGSQAQSEPAGISRSNEGMGAPSQSPSSQEFPKAASAAQTSQAATTSFV